MVVDEFGGTAGHRHAGGHPGADRGRDPGRARHRRGRADPGGRRGPAAGSRAASRCPSWRRVLGHSFDREDVSTVGGLVLAEFGRVPRAGEAIDLRGLPAAWSSRSSAGGCGGSRSAGRRSRRRWSAWSGRRHDLARRRSRPRARGVRRHGRRRAHHGEPGRADPRRRPPAPRRRAVARLARPDRLLPHGRVGHHVARRAARRARRIPGLLAGVGRAARSSWLLALLAVPLVLFAAYLVPRWLTQPRAETVADRVIPLLRPWSRVAGSAAARAHGHPAHRLPRHLARGRRGRPPAPTTSW